MILCHCGKPLHYIDKQIERMVSQLIKQAGSQYLPVTTNGRTWLVQRHYIALHGLRAADLPTLGFEEVRDEA